MLNGNATEMREALLRCDAIAQLPETRELQSIKDMRIIISAALAAPPRNCDMPLVVDGPADNDADKAWIVFKHHNPDAYFDVSGLLRCIDWLFAPATERKGGVK